MCSGTLIQHSCEPQWSHKSDMKIAKWHCLATALPDNNILVVGGKTDTSYTDETEIATTS